MGKVLRLDPPCLVSPEGAGAVLKDLENKVGKPCGRPAGARGREAEACRHPSRKRDLVGTRGGAHRHAGRDLMRARSDRTNQRSMRECPTRHTQGWSEQALSHPRLD